MATRTGRPLLRLVPLDRSKAEELRRLIHSMAGEAAPEVVRELLAVIDRRAAASSGWRFCMTGPVENRDVVRWIIKHAIRPNISHLLWAEFKLHLRTDTNEILMSRADMIEVTGARSPHISEALSEFVRIGAIERRKEGREVRWFLNAKAATHLTGVARDAAQQAAPPLLALMQDSAPAS